MRGFVFLFFATSFLFAEPVEKAAKYHELLLKNADNETLMKRFLDAWLDEQDSEALEKWLEDEAKSGGVAERRVLAGYLEHIGAQERALEQYERALDLEPGSAKIGLAVARLKAAGLDFEGALQVLGKREDVEAVSLRGAYEHRLGNTKVALDLWRGLLKRKPGDRELREDLVSVFRQEGLMKEAQDLQKELIGLGNEPFQRALDQLNLGDLEFEAGFKDAALLSYRKVLVVSGAGSWMEREALHKLHEIFRLERDADGLRALLAELRAEMPHRVVLQKSFARQLVVAGEVDKGMAAFREILRRTPGDETLRLEFIELLAFAERYEEAAEEMEALIAHEATAERWLRLVELRENVKDDEGVLRALGKLEKLKAGDAVGVLEMARVYVRFELDEEALRVLEAGRGDYADSREISEALAVLLVELEREEEALAIWQAMAKKGGIGEVLRVVESQRRNGLSQEAFVLLAERRQELEDHFGGLRLYCELALSGGKIEPAWRGVQRLISLPQAFSDLQVAVDLGSVIGRKYGLEKAISELEDVEEENVLCLLATLQQLAGRLLEADAVLAGAEGKLAQRHHIVLLTRRRDYAGAVAQLRGMIGERVSLVQRKQLIELLERQGNSEGALAEVEEWKVSSPGEVQAWRKRAMLLVQLGRRKEAADELRRARNIFGRDDVDLTRELAKMQLPFGKHREALRLYDHLFRTAKTDEARLGFVGEMYAAAKQAGLEYELIGRFEREHQRAKREVFPLRLLAELYKFSYNHGARQEVLLKLHRLLPDDEKVLFELVALAEKNNDLSGARQLILDYAARTRSVEMMQRLAAMQIQAGEVDAGFKILNRIAPADLAAENVEAMVIKLWQSGEHQLVLEFLKKNEDFVSADWRLRSLHADFLAMVGQGDEAWEIWLELLKVESALGRPVASRGTYRPVRLPAGGQMDAWHWWQLLAAQPAYAEFGGRLRLSVLREQPNNAHEVRWLSLARLARLSLGADPSGKSWEEFMETLSHPWLAEVREWGLFLKNVDVPRRVEKEVEVTPEMRLQQMANEVDSTGEEFLELAAELAAENVILANSCRIHAAFKLSEGVEQLAALREVAGLIADEDGGGLLNAQLFTQLIGGRLNVGLLPSLREWQPTLEQQGQLRQLEPWWQKCVERAVAKEPSGVSSALSALGAQRLSGDFEGLFKNLDRLLEGQAGAKQVPNVPSRHLQRYLKGMPDRSRLLSALEAKHEVYRFVNRSSVSKLIPAELLKKAQELGWEPEGYQRLVDFAEGIPQVKDGLLRAQLFGKIGLEEKFLAEMDALADQGGLEEKLDALALRYAPDQWGNNEELLERLLMMERAGFSPDELSLLDAVTLGEAVKNRKIREMEDEKKTKLGEILVRFSATPAGRSAVSTLRPLYQVLGIDAPQQVRNNIRPRSRERQSYRKLLSQEGASRAESEQEGIERSFFRSLDASFAKNSGSERLGETVNQERYLGLKEKALALYEPGESRSYLKRIGYAKLCLAYGEREKARGVLVSLREERPYDFELDLLVLRSREAGDQVVLLDEMAKSGEIIRLIVATMKLANLAEGEEEFFSLYRRLISVMEERAGEFGRLDASQMWSAFQGLQSSQKRFGERSLRSMTSRLPKVKEGDDPAEGNWALRVKQRKLILDAFVEMMRLKSIRGQVLSDLDQNKGVLRLDDGNVEWMVFEALGKEPVTEKDQKSAEKSGGINVSYDSYDSRGNASEWVALEVVQGSKSFSEESVDQLVQHHFLSEEQGVLVKAVLKGDAVQVEKIFAKIQEEREAILKENAKAGLRLRPAGSASLQDWGGLVQDWEGLLKTLLTSERWEERVEEVLLKAMSGFKDEKELEQWELRRVCKMGELKDSLAALEAYAANHFPVGSMYESYQKLKAVGVVPSEEVRKINEGETFFTKLQKLPRAWIPLQTFLEKSDRAVWVKVDEKLMRSQLQRRLDVMYKRVFYDRLRQEGFGSYDGLALLGKEELTETGEISTSLEMLISPLKLSVTDGKTYWMNVSEDCQEQVEEVTYLEAFIAMRKDFKISDEERQEVLRKVLESELEELSGLSDDQLRGLANLVRRDFAGLVVTEASMELERFLKRLRNFPEEGVVKKVQKMMVSERVLTELNESDARALCTRLAVEGEVEVLVEFWVAYLKTRRDGSNYSALNSRLLTQKPFMGALNLVDSIRFVRLVRAALEERPEMAESIKYTRYVLRWQQAFYDFRTGRAEADELLPFLDDLLRHEGVTKADRRVLGGFLIRANLSGRSDKSSSKVFQLRVEKSALANHSPEVAETVLALSQMQGEREEEEDAKALEVLYSYLNDPELMPDFRADLAGIVIRKIRGDQALLEMANAEPVGVALRDLLLKSSYGMMGNLSAGGLMLDFVNQHLKTVPVELQREIYEAWILALRTDAKRVLSHTFGGNPEQRVIDGLFDFTDGGRRFPLPQNFFDELGRNFSGDLDVMQRLINTGKGELVAGLLPGAEEYFKLRVREYSAETFQLENEVLPKLPASHQVWLKCYFANLRDVRSWIDDEESVGRLRDDRALSAARFLAESPPEEQAIRLRAINHLKNSDEALAVLVPLFADQFQDDLSAMAKGQRGDVRYMLRWLKSGGGETVAAFAPNAERALRMNGVRYYEEALVELEKRLRPSLSAFEKMRLTCELALLRDREEEAGGEAGLPLRSERMAEAARYILANPLPEGESEAEKKLIVQLVRGGLGEAEVQALLQRHLKNVKVLDAATLSGLPLGEAELLAYQLRALIDKGDTIAAMTCLRVLADAEAGIPERQAGQLINIILPKVVVPLMGEAIRQKGDGAENKILAELKNLSANFFTMVLSKKLQNQDAAQRAVLFLAFATHCLSDDQKGFEALVETGAKEGESLLKELSAKRYYGSFTNSEISNISPAEQPLYFDGQEYYSDAFMPLRKSLFEKIRKSGFTGLDDEISTLNLLKGLKLKAGEVELGKDDLAADRGDFDLMATAILAGDDALFLELLPNTAEVYVQRYPRRYVHYTSEQRRADALWRELGKHWASNGWIKELGLIKDEFQRMHFEIYMQSVFKMKNVEGTIFDLGNLDAEMEGKIFKLLPESGRAREQIIGRLAREIQAKSQLAQALIMQASAEGFEFVATPDTLNRRSINESFDTFVFGWSCALHGGDWSVLDRQFQFKNEDEMPAYLVRLACIQALYQVTDDVKTRDEVLKKLAQFGVKRSDPNFVGWLEVIDLLGGAEASAWKESWEALEAEEKKLAGAEMKDTLGQVLGGLSKVEFSTGPEFVNTSMRHLEKLEIWKDPSARDLSARVLAAVMDDDLGLFSAAGMSSQERASLMLEAFDWQQMKSCIEKRFEGEVEITLLTELALKVEALVAEQEEFQAFLETLAPQMTATGPNESKVWLKVANHRVSKDDLKGAKAARDKINSTHLKEYEVGNLKREIERLEAEVK